MPEVRQDQDFQGKFTSSRASAVVFVEADTAVFSRGKGWCMRRVKGADSQSHRWDRCCAEIGRKIEGIPMFSQPYLFTSPLLPFNPSCHLQGIVAAIRQSGGRFLEHNERQDLYFDIGDKKVIGPTLEPRYTNSLSDTNSLSNLFSSLGN
jgi:hypothetical protein